LHLRQWRWEAAESDDENADEAETETDITIDEQVLMDQNDIVVTATEYTTDSFWGDGINLLLENNSNQDVTLYLFNSEYENMDAAVDDTGTELYNEGEIRIVGKTVDELQIQNRLHFQHNKEEKIL
jgi:hypothetical protein